MMLSCIIITRSTSEQIKTIKIKEFTLVQIELMTVLTRTLKMAPFDRLNVVFKKTEMVRELL